MRNYSSFLELSLLAETNRGTLINFFLVKAFVTHYQKMQLKETTPVGE